MHLDILPETFAVLKSAREQPVPGWLPSRSSLLSITFTNDETSIVCQERFVPVDFEGEKEKGWRAVRVKGMLDFSMSGILTALTFPITEADISTFVISTYTTDYILIKNHSLSAALSIWKSQGHDITE